MQFHVATTDDDGPGRVEPCQELGPIVEVGCNILDLFPAANAVLHLFPSADVCWLWKHARGVSMWSISTRCSPMPQLKQHCVRNSLVSHTL